MACVRYHHFVGANLNFVALLLCTQGCSYKNGNLKGGHASPLKDNHFPKQPGAFTLAILNDLSATTKEHEGDSDSVLGHINTVHSEAELYAMIGDEDAVVKLAFTWCRPCKAFLPRYEKFAKIYHKTRFLKIVGNENESCKHYAKEVLHAPGLRTGLLFVNQMWDDGQGASEI